jgi:hypothetical protein
MQTTLHLGQFDRKGLIEPVGPIRLSDRGGENHQLGWRKALGQFANHLCRGPSLPRPLVRESKDELLLLAKSVALFEALQVFYLRFTQTGLPTDGRVIVQSVIAAVDLAGF